MVLLQTIGIYDMSKNIRREDWEELKPTVYDWGINDVNYPIYKRNRIPNIDGKYKTKIVWHCPYYRDWHSMLCRCFSCKKQKHSPTYIGCTVSEDWRYLSNFIKWVDSQPNRDWIDCSPDKDFLIEGNKHYSPETVVYISKDLNKFINDGSKHRGFCMIGVVYRASKNKKNPYEAYCNNPFTKKQVCLGSYPTEIEAHKAWQAKKHEHACSLAKLQYDSRVEKILLERYLPEKDWRVV